MNIKRIATGHPRSPIPVGTRSPLREVLGPLGTPATGHSCTKSRVVICFPAKGLVCPFDCVRVCPPTRECWWRGVLALTGRLTRTTWGGQGRVPMASSAVPTEERGTDTPRAWRSCSRSGHLPWLLGTRALAVCKVTNDQVNPSPLLSPERGVRPGPSCSPMSLLPGSPPPPPAGHPACLQNSTPTTVSRVSSQPLCAQGSRPLLWSMQSFKLYGAGLQDDCQAPGEVRFPWQLHWSQ